MKLKLLAVAVALASSSAFAEIRTNTEFGSLSFKGNARLNSDLNNDFSEIESRKNSTTQGEVHGRVLLKINGEKILSNQYFAGFDVQPKLHISGGKVDSEDVAIYLGQKTDSNKSWMFKAGRFEAYDLFDLLGDTYTLEDYGDIANKVDRGLGRGQALNFSIRMDEFYFETNALISAKSRLERFTSSEFEDIYDYSYKNNEIYIRPVVGYFTQEFDLAAGAEFTPARGFAKEDEDHATYYSLGGSATYRVPGQPLTAQLNISYANKELQNYSGSPLPVDGKYQKLNETSKTKTKTTTVGLSMQYQDFAIGGVYAQAKTSKGDIDLPKENLYSVYSSYKFANTLGFNNLDTTVAGAFSQVKVKGSDDKEHKLGGRIRLQYNF